MYLDFLYMILKLSTVLKVAVLTDPADAKCCAAGYTHTYFDTRDINLPLLSQYPSDAEISAAAHEAYKEASSLFAYLGVHPNLFNSSFGPTQELPSIHSILSGSLEDGFSDSELEMDQPDGPSEAQILQDLIEKSVDPTVGNHSECEHMYMLTFAAVSASVDNTIRIQSLLESDPEDLAEVFAQVSGALKKVTNTLVPIREIAEVEMRPNDRGINALDLDFSIVIKQRASHQTRHTVSGACTHYEQLSLQSESLRSGLIRGFNQVLHEQQERGVGTGLKHAACWVEGVPSTTIGEQALPTPAGNAANATKTEKSAANAMVKQHALKFHEAGVPHATLLFTAMVTEFNKLSYGDFGIVLWNERLVLAKVVHLYAKNGGKPSNHSWVAKTSSIGLLSYLVLQVFENLRQGQFKDTPRELASLYVKGFGHILSAAFLYRFPGSPIVGAHGDLVLPAQSFQLWQEMQRALRAVKVAVKAITACSKNVEGRDED
ncbi:hypothetical protein K439DRAFT_1613107 [Ramaria rubella]|nr:hypothetical protein K439DRAFT_1613107 [Ramaria rubella]